MPPFTARNLARSSSRSASSLVLITRKGSSLADHYDDDEGVTAPPDGADDAMACSQ
eukprot:evm.model.NODE_28269_length_9764_cov_34.789738.1